MRKAGTDIVKLVWTVRRRGAPVWIVQAVRIGAPHFSRTMSMRGIFGSLVVLSGEFPRPA